MNEACAEYIRLELDRDDRIGLTGLDRAPLESGPHGRTFLTADRTAVLDRSSGRREIG